MASGDLAVALAAGAGLVGGAAGLVRGLQAWRAGERVADIATSTVGALAAGEVRLVGNLQPVALTLISPLQSRPCLYYRARVRQGSGRDETTIFEEQRAIGFVLDDGTGGVRVLPRDAHWDVPWSWQGSTDILGDDPPQLALDRSGGVSQIALDREAQVRELLTVHQPARPNPLEQDSRGDVGGATLALSGGRRYEEARLEPGQTVTIVGSALPYRDVADPATADRYDPTLALSDPEISADLAAARAAGTLETDPAEAWGNAAIPGFGIGRPTRPPDLDPAATPEAVVPNAQTAEAALHARFEIPDDVLVVAATPEAPLTVHAGAPEAVAAGGRGGLWLAVGGLALLAISAVGLAVGLGAVP